MSAPRKPLRSRSRALAAVVAASALALSACGGGDDAGGSGDDGGSSVEPVSQEEIDEAMSTPTTLTFWTWLPDAQKEVDLFEAAYPDIDVELVNAGQGLDQYTKLRTAIRAGEGAPDVVQIEYQYLPSFTLGGDLLDLGPYGAAELEDTYPEWVWEQITQGEGVYGIPQDIGPMGSLYRQDILDEVGITAPTTWDEFAEAARTMRQAKPDTYLTNMPGNDPGQFVGLLWQNGAKPFGFDGDQTVTIDLDTPEVTEVVDYWQGLIQEDAVSTDADFNDQWYQGLSNGKYASWQTAAWGPVFLQGTAANTSGLWRAAPLPAWEEGDTATGNWGGSTDAVLSSTENPIAAAQLAKFINTDPESALTMATEQFLFVPSDVVLEDPTFLEAAPEFFGGQQVNQLYTDLSEEVDTDFGWLPFMDYVYNSFNDTLGTAIDEGGDMEAGLQAWEEDITSYAEQQGFTVQ
ncbi:ABC transporter substrate-binding protein [Pseudokineococcus lusitanus]|uniref:Multiple sugar transport system substrate-binding protein n=1 Tax=Pseudokineococcus lusitanus TaxID=763993 RepID=A0A3N1GWN6_9ACTN|nr:sugar ABC transporter substrate-binding protein [Pseudokineococcus lusitanus]ROP34546.1 multiple sugar transport system substrate-binding protein [Pseudokineococcus lusitanus]